MAKETTMELPTGVDMETKTSEDEVSINTILKENAELKKANEKLARALERALDMIGKNYAQMVANELLKD